MNLRIGGDQSGAGIVQDFAPELEAFSLLSSMDGRFEAFLEDTPMYRAPEHRYPLPDYDRDIRPTPENVNGKGMGR